MMDPTELISLVKRMRALQLEHAMRGNPNTAVLADIAADAVDSWLSAWDQHEAVRGEDYSPLGVQATRGFSGDVPTKQVTPTEQE